MYTFNYICNYIYSYIVTHLLHLNPPLNLPIPPNLSLTLPVSHLNSSKSVLQYNIDLLNNYACSVNYLRFEFPFLIYTLIDILTTFNSIEKINNKWKKKKNNNYHKRFVHDTFFFNHEISILSKKQKQLTTPIYEVL